jgi:hypothetical protein
MQRIAILATVLVLATGAALAQEKDDWRAKTEKGLTAKVNVNFEETPLEDALMFLGQFANVSINYDPWLYAKERRKVRNITLKMEDVMIRTALTDALRAEGLAWDIRWGGVFVSTPGRLGELPLDARIPGFGETGVEESRALEKRILEEKVSFSFDQAGLPDVLEFIRNLKGVNIVVDDKRAADAEKAIVTASVEGMPIAAALSLLLAPHGFGYSITHGVVFVTDPKPAPKEEGRLVRGPGPEVLEAVGGAEVDLVFEDAPVEKAIAALSARSKTPIHLDPGLRGILGPEKDRVTLDARKVPASAGLRLVVAVKDLDADLRWGVVFVSTKERLAALPKEALPPEGGGVVEDWETALRKKLATSATSFSFEAATVAEALDFLSDVKAVNVVTDPKAVRAAAAERVSLAVKDLSLGDALALLLYPRGFRFELRHEVVYVTPGE